MRRRKQANPNITANGGASSADQRRSKSGSKFASKGLPSIPLIISTWCTCFAILYFSIIRKSNINEEADISNLSSLRPKPSNADASTTKLLPTDTNLNSPSTHRPLHLVFSTDCSTYMHWQSYLFFFTAMRVNQPGIITRIASGCTEEQLVQEKEWHESHIQNVMSDRFRIHFTPDYSGEKDYKFFNKPFGFRHFLEHGEFMVDNNREFSRPDDIVILCDPDFLLLRPITDDFSNENETLIHDTRKILLDHRSKGKRIVEHGNPFAQTWDGLGTTWLTYNIEEIAGEDSPARHGDESDTTLFYMVGPPYIGTGRDMLNIAVKWTEFAPAVLKENPLHHAEMYAYHMAAAHLELQHTLIDSLQISSAGLTGEGWQFFDNIPSKEICTFAANPDHSKYPLPSVIHYCYWQYAVDKYFFSKRKVPHDVFTCDAPLLVEPPDDVGSGAYQYLITEGKNPVKQLITAEKEKRNGFILCAITKAINEAMLYFKDHHCEGGGNREKTYDLWAARSFF